VPPISGEAGELNEPTWLWPKHTMRLSGTKECLCIRIGMPLQFSAAMVRSAVFDHERATRTAWRRFVLIVVDDN
jgi:hypothetical protein